VLFDGFVLVVDRFVVFGLLLVLSFYCLKPPPLGLHTPHVSTSTLLSWFSCFFCFFFFFFFFFFLFCLFGLCFCGLLLWFVFVGRTPPPTTPHPHPHQYPRVSGPTQPHSRNALLGIYLVRRIVVAVHLRDLFIVVVG